MIGEGNHRHFLTDIHEQHPVVDRVHKMLQSPGFEAPMGHGIPTDTPVLAVSDCATGDTFPWRIPIQTTHIVEGGA
jgi:hypothetical protein